MTHSQKWKQQIILSTLFSSLSRSLRCLTSNIAISAHKTKICFPQSLYRKNFSFDRSFSERHTTVCSITAHDNTFIRTCYHKGIMNVSATLQLDDANTVTDLANNNTNFKFI
jgi:hypothetical protein